MQAEGMYPPPPGTAPPDLPGLELAGEVVATGPGCRRFRVGDRVMAVVTGAGQAELAVVPELVAMPVPDGVGWAQAGGFPENYTTAHDALFTQCGLGMGERVCVHGAAGGVGTAAVELAVAAGCEVVATVRNEASRAGVAALGRHRRRARRRSATTGRSTSSSSWSARPTWPPTCERWPPGAASPSSAWAPASGPSSTCWR